MFFSANRYQWVLVIAFSKFKDAVRNRILGLELAETDGVKSSRMERRRQETRAKLLAATHELVVEQGIDKTTMSSITDKADLGRRTFYYHFASKDEAITAAAAHVYQQHAVKALELAGVDADPAFMVAAATQMVIRGFMKEPITACLTDHPRLLGDALYIAIGEFVHNDINQGIKQNRFNPPIRENFLDSLMMWSLTGLMIEAAESGSDIAEVLKEYALVVLLILGVDRKEAEALVEKAYKHLN